MYRHPIQNHWLTFMLVLLITTTAAAKAINEVPFMPVKSTTEIPFMMAYFSPKQTVYCLFSIFKLLDVQQQEEFIWLIRDQYPKLAELLRLLNVMEPQDFINLYAG